MWEMVTDRAADIGVPLLRSGVVHGALWIELVC